jgi:membrane-bound metal-dependent hydrolase YbcI (DUF457 family)
MPSSKTHKKFGKYMSIIIGLGLCIWLMYEYRLTISWKAIFLPIIIWAYSQMPDIDHWASKIRKVLYIFLFSTCLFAILIYAFFNTYAMLVIITVCGFVGLSVLLLLRHRGFMHTYTMSFLFSIPLLFVDWYFFIIGFVCYSSHVLLDDIYSGIKRKICKLFNINYSNKYLAEDERLSKFFS